MMLKKIKNIIVKTDRSLFKIFGSDKSIKFLQNMHEVKKIFSCLNEIGEDINVRFVGGCVRQSLSGEVVDDIDLATLLKPEEVKEKLAKENIKVIDTGISHGTVTAIIDKKKFEITTLRKDISTDGRHANVKFTSNWEEDALRRDFTINAIYSDIEGRTFDPLNGVSDLRKGIIKFIGSSEERIQEDYLRILRYFRFHTKYSTADYDQDVMRSIKKNINGLNKISNERIYIELNKILKLENFYSLFFNNQSLEVILNIFPQFKYYERLKIFKSLKKDIKNKYDECLILSLLILDSSSDYEYFCHKYKISNNLKSRFKNISQNYESLKSKKFYSEENIKKLIYFLGKNSVIDLLLFSQCSINKTKNYNIEKLLELVNISTVPKFPISGDYLKKYGYKTGESLGKKLKSLEEKWIENNFVIDKKTIKESLEKINKN